MRHAPQVPYFGCVVFTTRVHPFAFTVEAHSRHVLGDTVVVDDWIRVRRVQVVHTNVLVACDKANSASNQSFQAHCTISDQLTEKTLGRTSSCDQLFVRSDF